MSELITNQYRSAFHKWHEEAWVRSMGRRADSFDSRLDYFPRKLSALFLHPDVRSMIPPSKQTELLIYQLYVYLDFTVWLEMGPVNEVCNLLRRPDFLPWIASAMKEDAFKIYTDEAGHAQMCAELRASITAATGVNPILNERPQFLSTLDQLIHGHPLEFANVIKLFFVIVSETLITGLLSKLPSEQSVQATVRAVVSDHAKDEARHHAYFRALFENLWPRMPRPLAHRIGLQLPEIIMAFLQPDKPALTKIVEQLSLIHISEPTRPY